MSRHPRCGRAAGPAVRVNAPTSPEPQEQFSPERAETPPTPEDTAFEAAQSSLAGAALGQTVMTLMQAGIARATVLKCLVGAVLFVTPRAEVPATQTLLAAGIAALDKKTD